MKFHLITSRAFATSRVSCCWSTLAVRMVLVCCVPFVCWTPLIVVAQDKVIPLRWAENRAASDPFLAEKLAQPGDLTLRKTSLPEALFAIGQLWGLNLVVGEEVQGLVNCDFQNAPLSEILNTVLLSNGYSYRPFGRSLVIVRMADMGDINPLFETATIPVRFGDPADLVEGASVFNSPRGKTKAIPSARSLLVVDYPDRVALVRDFVSGLNSSTADNAAGSGEGELRTLQLQPQYVPAIMVKDAIGAVLSKEGKVIIIDGENRIVIVDYPYYLRLAQQVMEQVDRPRPQVRITAYIYDVGLQDFEALGLNWNNALKGRLDGGGEPQTSWAIDSLTKVPFADGAVGGAMTFFNMSNNFDLRATITALNTCKDSRLLADPNVVVVDNEQATVAIVSEIPFQQLTQTQQGGNIGTTAFREAGVKLNVVPHIAEDGTIQMVVEPEFSRLSGFTPETAQPIIDRRTAKTTVRVVNGQTLVIGGLRQRTDVGTFNGIPFLKDIPYLGVLFRSRETDVRESELIVFIKPEIVNYAEMLRCREAAALGTSHKYLDQMPIGEVPVPPRPLPPANPSQPGQWEEVPAPMSHNTPPTVEQSSPGLALAAQRRRSESARPSWQQGQSGPSAVQHTTPAQNENQAAPQQSAGGGLYRRLPPVPANPLPHMPATPGTGQDLRGTNDAYRDTNAAMALPVDRSYSTSSMTSVATTANTALAPSMSDRDSTTSRNPVASSPQSSSDPAAHSNPVSHPRSESSPSATPALPSTTSPHGAAEGTNPLRARGHRLNESDEIRSASWVNNVFRF